jgi:hypothetical protein
MGNPAQAMALARASAERFGRDAIDVELDLQAALERIAGPRQGQDTGEQEGNHAAPQTATPGTGTPAAHGVVAGAELLASSAQPAQSAQPRPETPPTQARDNNQVQNHG